MEHRHLGDFDLPEARTFFAKVESLLAMTDYGADELCVRLTGVRPEDFHSAAFNGEGGCETFVIDIVLTEFRRFADAGDFLWWPIWKIFAKEASSFSPTEVARICEMHADNVSSLSEEMGVWVELKFDLARSSERSYAYCAFREQGPTFIEVTSIRLVDGAAVAAPAPLRQELTASVQCGRPVLIAFHVGQGMCASADFGERLYLIDCGAGIPIRRDRYWKDPGLVNQMVGHVKRAPNGAVSAIISHADGDHYRLLEWDAALLSHVDHIYVPDGQPFLIFSSKKIKGKVKGISGATISVNAQPALIALRSQSATPGHSNSDGLVVTVDIDGKRALLAGDYVYTRMKKDGNAEIQALLQPPTAGGPAPLYHAIVAPHHGDLECRLDVPEAAVVGQSVAFFSAGNHSTWCHPLERTLMAHSEKGYRCINDKTSLHIIGHQLLP